MNLLINLLFLLFVLGVKFVHRFVILWIIFAIFVQFGDYNVILVDYFIQVLDHFVISVDCLWNFC